MNITNALVNIIIGLGCFFLAVGILVCFIATIVYIGIGVWNQDSKKGAIGIKFLVATIVMVVALDHFLLQYILTFIKCFVNLH